jgi:hypothetical protein
MSKFQETINTAIFINIGTAVIIVADMCAHVSASKYSTLSSEPLLNRNYCVWYSFNALYSESVQNLGRATEFPDGGKPFSTVHVNAGIVTSYVYRYRVFQEERSVFGEVIVSVILSKKM